MCQILVSLIDNAMKFTAQGSITVRVALTSQSADEVVLHWTVTDTGIGIPEGHQRLILKLSVKAMAHRRVCMAVSVWV